MSYKDIAIILNLEQANLVLSGLDKLSSTDKKKVTFQKLYKEVENIKTVWERRNKNDKIIAQKKPVPKAQGRQSKTKR